MKSAKITNENCLLSSLVAKAEEKPTEKAAETKPEKPAEGEKTATQKAMEAIASLFSKSLEKTKEGLAKMGEGDKFAKRQEQK